MRVDRPLASVDAGEVACFLRALLYAHAIAVQRTHPRPSAVAPKVMAVESGDPEAPTASPTSVKAVGGPGDGREGGGGEGGGGEGGGELDGGGGGGGVAGQGGGGGDCAIGGGKGKYVMDGGAGQGSQLQGQSQEAESTQGSAAGGRHCAYCLPGLR